MAREWIIAVRRSLGRRWLAWFAGIGLFALIGLFPLRIALGMSDLARIGFTARQVAGTIWYGRIGELQLRAQPFGTFEVELDPTALILGNVGMSFNRMDSPEGVLKGRLIAGFRRGIIGTSGRIAIGELFAPLPIEALELNEVTLLFRDGTCVEASGRVVPIVNSPVPGVAFAGLSGAMQCDGARARSEMQSASGNERIEFTIDASGRYRAWMTVRGAAPEVGATLTSYGFKAEAQGMTLSVDGQL